jgi:hypothetical protein
MALETSFNKLFDDKPGVTEAQRECIVVSLAVLERKPFQINSPLIITWSIQFSPKE